MSKRWMAALALLGAGWSAQAAIVTSDLQQQDADTWLANFVVTNNDPALNYSSITFFLQQDAFSLATLSNSPGWDLITVEPNTTPSPGYADALASPGFELYLGQQAQFRISFDWTLAEKPVAGGMMFTINDPANGYAVLTQGNVFAAAVPEPSTWALMAAGSLLLLGAARRRRAF